MKRIIQLLLLVVIALFSFGIYLQNFTENSQYQKVMGIGVLIMVFLLLPTFLYYRYKDKNLEDYKFKGFNNDTNKNGK